MSSSFELPEVERITVGTVGEPGQRTFYLQARMGAQLVTLKMEKQQVGALAQLSTPLTHELFHLWVPNILALDGDYDWFYEGFTVYEAARTAVRLDLLTFPEFLNALARAYDGYLANAERDRLSLVEASKRRWTAGPSAVYSESMVVAFLYDLRLRMQSRGKQSIENIYPLLLQKYGVHANGEPVRLTDGNDAALNVLGLDEGTRAFVRAFVTQPAKIDLPQELASFGLKVETFGLRTRIGVSDNLTKQQRDLLRQLGYNDVTRKRKN
jgi:predicted metalloprotease with PDZ domain